MKVNRTYESRDYGHIGSVTLEAPDAPFLLDGEELSVDSVEHLLMFALQTLQDAYAGAESATDARERFKKKYDRIAAGTIGAGGGRGPALDAVTEEAHRILMTVPLIKKTADAMKGKGSAERRRTYLNEKLADNPDVRTQAEANVESARNMALKIKV